MSTEAPSASLLGTLGFHVDGRPCRVGCSYCYLGVRPPGSERSLPAELAAQVVARLPAREVALSVSEPARLWRPHVEAVSAAARARGLPFAVTTTAAVVEAEPWVAAAADRLTLSIDPAKGGDAVDVAAIARATRGAAREGLEIVALTSLVSPAFSARLADGLLADLLALDSIDAVGLNGLKPPPPWCNAAHWIRLLGRIRRLLDAHLGKRLFLDCYVSARILGLSGCPAKPDVAAGREFRSCVYQREPDFVFSDADDLAARVAGYQPPAVCPFPIV